MWNEISSNFYMRAVSLFSLQINWGAAGHYGDCQGTGQRSLIGGAETERRRRTTKKKQRAGGGGCCCSIWVRDFSGDKVLYFEVCGGTVCRTKSPQSFVYYCHVCSLCFHRRIHYAWVKSFGPGETNSRGIGMRCLCVLSGQLSTRIDVADIRNTPLNPVDTRRMCFYDSLTDKS